MHLHCYCNAAYIKGIHRYPSIHHILFSMLLCYRTCFVLEVIDMMNLIWVHNTLQNLSQGINSLFRMNTQPLGFCFFMDAFVYGWMFLQNQCDKFCFWFYDCSRILCCVVFCQFKVDLRSVILASVLQRPNVTKQQPQLLDGNWTVTLFYLFFKIVNAIHDLLTFCQLINERPVYMYIFQFSWLKI